MTPSASPRTRKFAAGQASGEDVMAGPPTATGFPRARQRSTMSSESPPCGSMPPVKTRSAHSRSASVNCSVLRSTSRTDQAGGRSAATVIRPSGGAVCFAPTASQVFLKLQNVSASKRGHTISTLQGCAFNIRSPVARVLACNSSQVDDCACPNRMAWFRGRGTALTVRQHPVFDMAVAGVAPHDVADAIVVEVADAYERRSERMRAQTSAARPMAVLDQPHVDVVVRWIVPDDVIGAVLVEVADAGDLIAGGM